MTAQCPRCRRWFGLTDRWSLRTHRIRGTWCDGSAMRPVDVRKVAS